MNRIIAFTTMLAAPLAAHASASAAEAQQLLAMVNAWRTAPAACEGRQRGAVAPLSAVPVLSRVALRPNTILLAALDQAGYDADVADALQVAGPADARAAFDALRDTYCDALGSTRFRDMGARREGNEWTITLARPTPNPLELLPPLAEAAQQVLAATNAARAVARHCGAARMMAAPPLRWNPQLAAAALAHSQDMAQQGYFAHHDAHGHEAQQRIEAQGYLWRNVGENIARGQTSAREAVDSWLTSPGHCRALMNPYFTEMGAAYDIRAGRRPAAYWTQVFAAPR